MSWSNTMSSGYCQCESNPFRRRGGVPLPYHRPTWISDALVRNMVELPRTLRVREGTFSCGDGSKLIAHLPSRSRQAFEPALVIKPLLLSKEVQIKRHLAGDEDPNDSG